MKRMLFPHALSLLLWVAPDLGPAAEALYPQDANTPMAASRDPADLQVAADIRRALMADDDLSIAAKHVQMITNSQAVILRGAVRAQEVEAVEQKAKEYAGVRQIINQLTVADY